MKCPSCGAEIGTNKYCEFCGTQIPYEMLQKQEQLNKAGCPKCGSTNIQFRRENQGEVRGKNSRQVIHRTVGICKDCGATWYPNAANEPKKKRTWLWVLGWICIFPVPLTILMLRKKDMKPALKYGIIAAAWIVYLLIGLSGNSTNKASSEAAQPTELVDTVSDDSATEKIDVTLAVEPNINTDDGTVLFGVKTNLPENTKFLVTVFNDDYTGQDSVVILSNGVGFTSEFSDSGHGLIGTYHVRVTMSLPSLQDDSVKDIIGENGENLTGRYVTQSFDDSSNTVEGIFEFTFE